MTATPSSLWQCGLDSIVLRDNNGWRQIVVHRWKGHGNVRGQVPRMRKIYRSFTLHS